MKLITLGGEEDGWEGPEQELGEQLEGCSVRDDVAQIGTVAMEIKGSWVCQVFWKHFMELANGFGMVG